MRVGELLGLRDTDLIERDRNHVRLADRSQRGGAKGHQPGDTFKRDR